jgi:hypothetical protein
MPEAGEDFDFYFVPRGRNAYPVPEENRAKLVEIMAIIGPCVA